MCPSPRSSEVTPNGRQVVYTIQVSFDILDDMNYMKGMPTLSSISGEFACIKLRTAFGMVRSW